MKLTRFYAKSLQQDYAGRLFGYRFFRENREFLIFFKIGVDKSNDLCYNIKAESERRGVRAV